MMPVVDLKAANNRVAKKCPKARSKPLLAVVCAYLVFGLPQPSPASQVPATAQNYQEKVQGIDVLLLNKNDDPQPGDRLSFQETQGDHCIYHGKVIEPGQAILNRKKCSDGVTVPQDAIVPLNTRGTGERINNFKAFIKVNES